MSINEMSPQTGRTLREDGTSANLADAAVPASIKGCGTLAATTTPAPLTTTLVCSLVQLQNDPANTTNVLYGGSVGQTMVLPPGQVSTLIPIANAALIYVKMASLTGNVNWFAL